jgi:RNA polymerase sigma-70 factor (ECF subfamily)
MLASAVLLYLGRKYDCVEINLQLIRDCIKKDRKAQFMLYKQCHYLLMPVCLRYQSDADNAASMLNVGFMKILDKLDTYSKDKPFEAWAKRIMINTLIDDFRKQRKVKELIEYTDFSDHTPTEVSIDFNEADKQFDAQQLERMIQQLPPMSQKVFNLYALDGYKHLEIAAMLQISEGTSKWHLSSARKKLQEMIKSAMNSSKVI